MKRYARVDITREGRRFSGSGTYPCQDIISSYLPGNYKIARIDMQYAYIEGEDNRGWTLDEYVLPRLASGNYFGEEIKTLP